MISITLCQANAHFLSWESSVHKYRMLPGSQRKSVLYPLQRAKFKEGWQRSERRLDFLCRIRKIHRRQNQRPSL